MPIIFTLLLFEKSMARDSLARLIVPSWSWSVIRVNDVGLVISTRDISEQVDARRRIELNRARSRLTLNSRATACLRRLFGDLPSVTTARATNIPITTKTISVSIKETPR